MTDKFEIGEIVIAVNDETMTPEKSYLRYNHEECTIMDAYTNFTMQSGDGWVVLPVAYRVWFGDGNMLIAAPHELRKLDDWKKEVIRRNQEWAENKVKELIAIGPLVLDPVEEMVDA